MSSDFANRIAEHRDTSGWSVSTADHPTWLFAKVPEANTRAVRVAGVNRTRMHFDLRPDDHAAEVKRLEALGARRIDIGQGDLTWVVMEDPEGNEFWVLRSLDT